MAAMDNIVAKKSFYHFVFILNGLLFLKKLNKKGMSILICSLFLNNYKLFIKIKLLFFNMSLKNKTGNKVIFLCPVHFSGGR